MIATAACFGPFEEWTVSSLFSALASRFGGDTAPLEEEAILRLVDEARAGNRSAGQRLYRLHVDRVFRTVRGILHSDMDAEEVTQDAMLTVLTSLDRYAPRTDTRFAAWVTTIAMNTARRRFRRRRPEATDPSELTRVADNATDIERDVDSERQVCTAEGTRRARRTRAGDRQPALRFRA